MLICQEKDCTGCMACVSVCAKGAISVSHDSSGFSHPVIDEGKCVKCNRCKTICPCERLLAILSLQRSI